MFVKFLFDQTDMQTDDFVREVQTYEFTRGPLFNLAYACMYALLSALHETLTYNWQMSLLWEQYLSVN